MHVKPMLAAASLLLTAAALAEPFDHANPMIGTGGEGHTYPGATVPFGLVQLSPDTKNGIFKGNFTECCYAWAAGYRYEDSVILGFSHTHFSGTGHSDFGDLLIMPTTGKINFTAGDAATPGYRSRYSHDDEVAQPGYYAVGLKDYGIRAEMTTSERVGVHRYTFPQSDNAHLIIDLTHAIYNTDDKVLWSSLRVDGKQTITGYRMTTGWAKFKPIYFAIQFSRPFESFGMVREDKRYGRPARTREESDADVSTLPELQGRALKAAVNFKTSAGEQITVKVGISYVSPEGALKNLQAEVPHWDFDRVRAEAKAKWQKELGKFEVQGTPEMVTGFYTSLYHSVLGPVVYNDVDGKYRGLDQNIHEAKGTTYAIFSLWDTYRALHPLFTYTQPKRVGEMITSMLGHYQQSPKHMLPIWSFHGNETGTMIGYHAVSVIADAYVKGLRDFDAELAYQAAKDTANRRDFEGLDHYIDKGYVAHDLQNESASKTAEYAYDDFAIAQFAKAMGRQDDYQHYMKRAMNYQNTFDAKIGFMRGRLANGAWEEPFDPELAQKRSAFTEGSSMQYSWYVPHDVGGLIKLMGGKQQFVKRLDALFDTEVKKEKIAEHEDISGLIGQYVQGNEPSHHIAYLYNYAGQAWKTQGRIHQVMSTMYFTRPDGLPGNDDIGQMSAWYIFSAMGFYPVAPNDLTYAIGAPQLERAVLKLADGKQFTMIAHGLGPKKFYIDHVLLNGKPLTHTYIEHKDIAGGGTLEFFMRETPNKNWGAAASDAPPSISAIH
ncbi:MAG: GH92 family glycosyl hydrolase [Pseudomonadota bacterium]